MELNVEKMLRNVYIIWEEKILCVKHSQEREKKAKTTEQKIQPNMVLDTTNEAPGTFFLFYFTFKPFGSIIKSQRLFLSNILRFFHLNSAIIPGYWNELPFCVFTSCICLIIDYTWYVKSFFSFISFFFCAEKVHSLSFVYSF